MSVKPCNIRIPSGLSDAQVAADAACAAKRYAYSAEQVESRLNNYVEDLTGLDLEQIAANTAAAADIVNTVTTARDEAVEAANTVEELAPQVKDMLDTIVEQDLEQLRQDIAVATDLIATVDGKVTAAQTAATDAAGSALQADQSETAAEAALAETWTAYSAVLSEKETASADFEADAEGKVAAAVEAQLSEGGDFYEALDTAVTNTIPSTVKSNADAYVTQLTSAGGSLYDYVEESKTEIRSLQGGAVSTITTHREAALTAITTAEGEAIASIESKVDADIAEKINPEYISEKVESVLPGLIESELADENGAWNREKTATIEAATAQAELAQSSAQNAYASAESASVSASAASASAGAALSSEQNAQASAEDATEQAELARQWAISEEHVAGSIYNGAMYYAKAAATDADKAAAAATRSAEYSVNAADAAIRAAQYSTNAAQSAQNAYDYSMRAAQHESVAVQAAQNASEAMDAAQDSAQTATSAKEDVEESYSNVLTAYEGVLNAYENTLNAYEGAKAAMVDAEGFATDANAAKESIGLIVDSANWQNQNISVDTVTGAFTTTPGSVYAVWCKESCAIYKDAEFVDKLCTIWPEEQRCFMATQTSYYVSPVALAAAISINTAYYLRTEN